MLKQIKKYLVPEIIYEDSSEFNQNIKVIELGNIKKLVVNGLVQSISPNSKFAKKRVWGELANIVNENIKNTQNLLLLGMGGGTMLHILSTLLNKEDLQITSVEIDEKIVNIAKKYFDIEDVKNNKIIIGDAAEIIQHPERYDVSKKYDCIIVDTYLGDNYPENIKGKEFVTNLLELASKDCLVVFNRIFADDNLEELKLFQENISKFIPNIKTQKIDCKNKSNNYVIFGYNNK